MTPPVTAWAPPVSVTPGPVMRLRPAPLKHHGHHHRHPPTERDTRPRGIYHFYREEPPPTCTTRAHINGAPAIPHSPRAQNPGSVPKIAAANPAVKRGARAPAAKGARNAAPRARFFRGKRIFSPVNGRVVRGRRLFRKKFRGRPIRAERAARHPRLRGVLTRAAFSLRLAPLSSFLRVGARKWPREFSRGIIGNHLRPAVFARHKRSPEPPPW